MRSPRLATLVLGFLLLPAAGARAGENVPTLFRQAAEVAAKRGRVDEERAQRLRGRLAAVPREALDDKTWIDLHLLIGALGRRLDPAPPGAAPVTGKIPVPPAGFPPEGLLGPRADPVDLLDAAAECRRLQPPPGARPAAKEEKDAVAASAARLLRLAREAAAFESEDLLADAAAAVLADAARDLAFDLHCRAIGRIPVGRERFGWLLARRHGLEYTPEEVRDIGVRVRAQILAELEALARETSPGKSWQELTEIAREDRADSTEELLAICEAAMETTLHRAIDSGLVTVPETARSPRIELLDAVNPGFPTPYAMYRPRGPRDGNYRGTFVVTAVPENLPEAEQLAFLRGRERAWMEIIAGHEAVPGHHLQHAIAAGVESDWRHFGYTSVYVEGWGLYSEDLLDRAGAVDTPARKLALLRLRLWRAVRVIVDVGLHTGGLRPSDAVRMLVEVVRMDRWTAEQEVSRYLVSPTQPLSYLVGYEKMKAIRRAWLARYGPESEREFNDRLLALGPVPLDLAAAVLLRKRAAYDHSHP